MLPVQGQFKDAEPNIRPTVMELNMCTVLHAAMSGGDGCDDDGQYTHTKRGHSQTDGLLLKRRDVHSALAPL